MAKYVARSGTYVGREQCAKPCSDQKSLSAAFISIAPTHAAAQPRKNDAPQAQTTKEWPRRLSDVQTLEGEWFCH